MRSPALLLIGAATVCGMVASIGLSQLLESPAGKQVRAVEQVRIYVAQRDIAPGQTLSEANLKLETWDADSVPPGVVLRFEDTVGKVVRDGIKAGDPLQMSWLTAVSRPPAPQIATPTQPPASPVQSLAEPIQDKASSSPQVADHASTVTAADAAKTIAQTPGLVPDSSPATAPETAVAAVPPQSAVPPQPSADPAPALPSSPPAPSTPREATQDSVADSSPQFAATEAPRTSVTVRKPKAVGSISDAGWVMTIRREGGVKSLRYRVTSEADRESSDALSNPAATEPAEVEQQDDRAARKSSDSKKS